MCVSIKAVWGVMNNAFLSKTSSGLYVLDQLRVYNSRAGSNGDKIIKLANAGPGTFHIFLKYA